MKQIGKLSASACQRLLSSAPISNSSKLILEELGTILDIKKFKNKARAKSITSRDCIYVTINEERYTTSINEEENPKEDFISLNATTDLSKLTLDEICAFQKFNDKYVLPSTIKKHVCPKLEPCPVCNDGMCLECNGEKNVTCNACDGNGECTSCEGSGRYPCYSCNQSGECRHCYGTGEEDCDDCDGDGWVWDDCRACNGTGRYTLRNGYDVECRVCHGSGHHHKEDCWTCNGTGSVDCHVCDGSGQCQKCGGEGTVECRDCHGTGTCRKCKGKGRVKCRNCRGTGICPSCKGSESIPCRRCLGTGVYQTFKCISLEHDAQTVVLKDKSIERQLGVDLGRIDKRQVYNGIPYIIDFGKPTVKDNPLLDYLEHASDSSYRNKIQEYRNALIKSDNSPVIGNEIYSKTSILAEQFPLVKCSIEYSNELFTFYIIGIDGCVFADKTSSWWDKLCAWF